MSVAELGLVIDSSQAAPAAAALDKLSAIAGNTAAMVALLEKSAAAMAAMLPTVAAATNSVASAVTALNAKALPAADGISALGKTVEQISVTAPDAAAGLTSTTSAIVGLDAAAAPAAATITNLRNSTGAFSVNMGSLQKTLAAATADLNVQGVALKNGTVAVTALAGAHAGYSTQAMAAFHATRSMAEGLAMGLPPSQMLAQQMAHLSYAASGPGGITGAFKEMGSMVAGLIGPTTIMTAGFVAVGAALYASYASWKNYALQLDDVRRLTGETSQGLAAMNNVAAMKGIDDTAFFDAMRKFSGDVYSARNNMGSLADLMRVNGGIAKDTESAFERIADLVKNSSDDQQRIAILQQAGLPTTRAWLDLMSQGAQGIRDMEKETQGLGGAIQDQMIQKAKDFDQAWNSAVRNLRTDFQSFFLWFTDEVSKVGYGINGLVIAFDKATGGNGMALPNATLGAAFKGNGGTRLTQGTANDFYGAFGKTFAPPAAQTGATQDPNVLKNQISLEQQRLGLLGQTATVEQQVRMVQLQLNAAGLAGAGVTGSQADNLIRLARERALGIDQIKAQKDSYDVETASIGMNIGQAAAYAAVQNKINEYKRNGIPLTQENINAITAEAQAMGVAAQRVDDLKFEFDTFSGMMRDFGSNLRQGQTAWQAFENAGVNALGKIADRLMDMASRSLWNAAFPTSGGGGLFSFIGGIFGGGSTPLGQGGIGHAATGATNWRGGPIMVGENGPEVINLPAGANITSNNMVAAMMGNGGAGQPIQVTVAPQYVFNNADPNVEARLRQQIAQSAADTQQKTVAAVQKLSQNSPGNYLPPKR